jgi:hypothetical protein
MRLRYVICGVFLLLLGTAYDLLLGGHTPKREYITMFAMGYIVAVADDIATIADDLKKKGSGRPFLKTRGDRATQKMVPPIEHQEEILSGTRRF